jgi:hypothetical protein
VEAARDDEDERQLSDALRLYCANQGAVFLLRPLAVLKKVSDGSNSMERASGIVEAVAFASAAASRLRSFIENQVGGPTPSRIGLMGISNPNYDPITG